MQEMFHRYDASARGRKVGRANNGVADVAACEFEALCKLFELQIRITRDIGGKESLPDAKAVGLFGKWEIYGELQTAGEGVVQVGPQVGGQDGHAVIRFHALEQVTDFNIGVAVVGVFDFGTFAKERVRFVEKQDGVAGFCLGKDAFQILFGFADVFADDGGEVNFEQVQPQLGGDNFGGHRFACAGRPRKEDRHAPTGYEFLPDPPFIQNERTPAHGGDEFSQ